MQAEQEFDVFLTIDRNLEYQQNLQRFRFGIVVVHVPDNRMDSYEPILAEFVKEGLGKKVEPVHFKEGNVLIPGFGVMAMFDKAPHPNAAKVFANWMLTREAQEEYHRATRQNSRRTDVPTFAASSVAAPGACENALDLQDRKSTRLNSSHIQKSRMPSSA